MILIVIIFCLHRSREESFVDYMLLERLDAVCLPSEKHRSYVREDSELLVDYGEFAGGLTLGFGRRSVCSWPCCVTTLTALLRYLRLASVTLARCRLAR